MLEEPQTQEQTKRSALQEYPAPFCNVASTGMQQQQNPFAWHQGQCTFVKDS